MPRSRILSDDTVLEGATSVFWRSGYAGTSLRDLTQATGLSAAALYHRFKDKDGLFTAVLRHYAQGGLTERLTRLSSEADPVGAIREFLNELIALSLGDPQHRGCLLVNTALDGAPLSRAARDIVSERLAAIETFFAERLEQALAEGTLERPIDVRATATALLGVVLAIRVMARIKPDAERLRALADHALARLPIRAAQRRGARR